MKQFPTWEAEIASVSGLAEFQNATIQIVDPSLLTTTYDYDSNEYTVTGDGVVYTGQARVQPLRSTNVGGVSGGNPTSVSGVTVQIPYGEVVVVKRGWRVQVTDGGRNTALEGFLFTVVSDVNSSHQASHTFEAMVDVEVNPEWA